MIQLLLLVALAAAPTTSLPVSARAAKDSITWTKCDPAFKLPTNLECGNLTVPVDWNDSSCNDTITLGMVKLPRPSNSTAERRGYLFVNPGGPGGSAVSTVSGIASGRRKVSRDLLESFDMIGVDPRGVGQSAGSNCDPAIWNERVSQFPKSKEDYDRLVDKNRRLGESCLARMGDVLKHLDTISAAKDHEAVREALGEKMNWLGLSYGTQLGSQYAQLFPDNIRVMVLDGMLQHSQTESSNILIEGTAYAAELTAFFKWASTNDSSPLKGQDVEQLWYQILKNSTTTPIPAPGCDNVSCRTDVNEEEIRFNGQNYVLSPTQASRTTFARALLQASQGNATLLSSSLASDEDPSLYAGITIGCQDWSSYASTYEDFQAKKRIGETFSPLNGGACQSWTLQASCVGWPVPIMNPPAKLKVQTQDPILMVNAIRDPSTSYTWAVGMLEEVQNNVLLTRNGDGHTSWGLGGATTDAINHFLITKELPKAGTVLDT